MRLNSFMMKEHRTPYINYLREGSKHRQELKKRLKTKRKSSKPMLVFCFVKPRDLTFGFYKSAICIPSFSKGINCVPTMVPRTRNAMMNNAFVSVLGKCAV